MVIRILITGGTIDGLEYNNPKNAPQDHKTLIPSLLKQARIAIPYKIEPLMAKDSKFVTDKDREHMLKYCKECPEKQIVITHGTTTMPLTAKYLGKAALQKTIVFLGAAIPANREHSDALFNLGAAFTAAQTLPHGVYVTMNGNVFEWNNVRKNIETGKFEKE